MRRLKFPKLIIITIFFLSLLCSSCSTQEDVNIEAWIDSPQDGAIYEVGTPIQIMSHVYAKDGFGEILLFINGEAYQRSSAPPSKEDLIDITQQWTPTEVGQYIIQVKVVDAKGEEGAPAIIGVKIIDKKSPQATLVITATPLKGDISPTSPEAGSPTPLDGGTATPVPGVKTNTPTIAIWTDTPTIHPTVTAKPVDNQAPPVPSPMVPANGLELSCRASQTLAWQPVNDMSGISGYYVKLELLSGTGSWQSAGGYGPLSEKQVDVPVNCGIKYRWMVRAQDGAGNFSDWSSMSEFIVTLD